MESKTASPDPVVVKFADQSDSKFQKPDHDPHGETTAKAAHSSTSCEHCGKTGLVATHTLEVASGVFGGPERPIHCAECGEE